MAYHEANLDRPRHFVGGRVLGFTTSRTIEFLEFDLSLSIPLYSIDIYPEGHALVFCVELHGYLTFEPGEQVKLIELGPYEKGDFSPSKFSVVRVADKTGLAVVSAQVTTQTFKSFYLNDVGGFLVEFTDGISNYNYWQLEVIFSDGSEAVYVPTNEFPRGKERFVEYYNNFYKPLFLAITAVIKRGNTHDQILAAGWEVLENIPTPYTFPS